MRKMKTCLSWGSVVTEKKRIHESIHHYKFNHYKFAYHKCSDIGKKMPNRPDLLWKGTELYFSSQPTFTWSKNILQGLEDKAVC